MAITKLVTYAGSVTGLVPTKLVVEREFEEVLEGNTRRQEPTGGLIVEATFSDLTDDGEDRTVREVVPATAVATRTLGQIITAARARLADQLGV